jgi:hypothetical protein
MKKTKRTNLVDPQTSSDPAVSQELNASPESAMVQEPVVGREPTEIQETVTSLESGVGQEPATIQEPVATVLAVTDKKEKAPSFTTSVRRVIIRHPTSTSAEISQTLIEEGWEKSEVERRKSTIATLRNDALAVIALVKEAGWTTPQESK